MLQPPSHRSLGPANPLLWSLNWIIIGLCHSASLGFSQVSLGNESQYTDLSSGLKIKTNPKLIDMEVLHVRNNPSYFVVNRGLKHDLVLGDLVCAIVAYDLDDEDSGGKKLKKSKKPNEVCGPIISIKPTVAGVSVQAPAILRVKVEQAAIAVYIPKIDQDRIKIQVRLGYHFGEKSPFTYKLTKFNIESLLPANRDTEPVWLVESERTSGFVAPFLGLSLAKPSIWPNGMLLFRLLLPTSPTDSVDVDYSLTDPEQHAKTTAASSATVLESTLSYEFTLLRHLSTGPLGGLQGGLYRLDYKVHQIDDKDGSTNRLLDYQSRWSAASLVLGWLARGTWKSLLAEGSWMMTYPVWMGTPSQSLQINLPEGFPVSGSDQEDFKKKVDLKKGSLAQHLLLSLGYQF